MLKSIKFKFEVWTDHKDLEYFMKVQKLRQAHWRLYLSRFDFTLKHILERKKWKKKIDLVRDWIGK